MRIADPLVARFFNEVRELSLGDRTALEFAADEILSIAESPSARTEFQRVYNQEINDPDLKRMVKNFIEDFADEFDGAVEEHQADQALIEKGGGRVSIAVTIAGIGTTVAKAAAGGSLLGPIGMLAGGGLGMIICGIGYRKKASAIKMARRSSTKLKRLIEP